MKCQMMSVKCGHVHVVEKLLPRNSSDVAEIDMERMEAHLVQTHDLDHPSFQMIYLLASDSHSDLLQIDK